MITMSLKYHDDKLVKNLTLHCGGRTLMMAVYKRVLEALTELRAMLSPSVRNNPGNGEKKVTRRR